jgi:hypothetical protein
MKKIIISSTLAVLLCTTAIADTSSMNSSVTGMGILENDYVKAGVNGTSGTFGSGGGTRPGLQFDSTGTGTFPADSAQGDYLTPGSPFDGFAIKIDGTNSKNNNSGSNAWTDADGLTDTTDGFVWTGTNSAHSGWEIENTYSLGATAEHVEIGTDITAGSDATDVYFGRFIDPDAMPETGDTSATDNVLGYGVIPDSNVAFAEATVSRYALGLYSTDSNVDAGISSWSTEADAYTENTVDGDGSNTNTGDNTIGLTWHWTGVSTGDILEANYAYIFGPSAFDAADSAITAGAGGGADVSSWGTLEDVGSATDAASGPTVVGTGTSSVTSHTSTTADGVQTIAREKATATWDIYSDATLGTATTTVETLDPFVGRMDQASQMLTLAPHRGVGIAEGFSAGRISHDMGNGYDAESNVFGLGHTTTTEDLLSVGLGINRITTDITGSDSTGNMSTTVLSFSASKHIDDRDMTVSGTVNASNTDLSYTRTIGDFAAAGSTTSTDRWGTLTIEKSTGTVRPFAGYTLGRNSHEAFTETGDVQSALLDAGTSDTYRYATIGVNIDTGSLNASFARDFDDAQTTRIGLGLNRAVNETIGIEAGVNRVIAGDNTSTTLNAGLTWKF